MSSIYDNLNWRTISVAADSATGIMNLHVGECGTSGPSAFISAGVHGDEGPWGALAIRHVLAQPMSHLTGKLLSLIHI